MHEGRPLEGGGGSSRRDGQIFAQEVPGASVRPEMDEMAGSRGIGLSAGRVRVCGEDVLFDELQRYSIRSIVFIDRVLLIIYTNEAGRQITDYRLTGSGGTTAGLALSRL